jgi:hypothetical protein
VLLISCAELRGTGPGGGSEPPTSLVHFYYDRVEPETVRVGANATVTWENIAGDTMGYVVFPVSIARSFRCSDLEPAFSRTPNDYRSLPIGGVERERLSLPCPLAPGSYDYEIWLVGSGFEEVMGQPKKVLRATIVVE